MVKKLMITIVLVVAALAGYNYMTTGSLMPSSSASPEDTQFESLEARVQSAGATITRAGQTAGLSGMDTTGDVERAMNQLEQVEKEIQDLQRKASSDEMKQKCERLINQSRSMRGAR
jgi:hypothetical protein